MNVSLWVFFLSPRWLILLTKPSIIQNSPWILLRLCPMVSAFTRDKRGPGRRELWFRHLSAPMGCYVSFRGAGLGVKGQQEDFLCLRQLGV